MDNLEKVLTVDRQLCFAVYSAAHAFNRAYKPLLDKLGLTYPQYLVMMVLWEKNSVPVKDIGAKLNLDSGTLSPLLKRLEKLGMISRVRDANDERQVVVGLTEQGKAAHKTALESIAPGIFTSLGCGTDEISELRDRLVKLRKTLDKSSCQALTV